MKFWILVLKFFGYAWVTLAVVFIGAGIIGVWMNGGFSAVQELLSPFNITNWLVTAVTLAPGIGALMWAVSRQEATVHHIVSFTASMNCSGYPTAISRVADGLIQLLHRNERSS